MKDAPVAVDVHIVPSTEAPSGCGEPPVPVIAPAVANALFRLTGRRDRFASARHAVMIRAALDTIPGLVWPCPWQGETFASPQDLILQTL